MRGLVDCFSSPRKVSRCTTYGRFTQRDKYLSGGSVFGMSSKIGKDVSLGGSKPPKSTSSSHISSSSVTGEIEKLIKTEDNNVIKSDANSSSIGNLSTKETPPAGDDKGAKIVAALGGGVDRDNLPGYIYKDPAPLKWRIFEAVAKTNGQR